MTAAETIAKAIEKLERLKAESTPHPWHYATDDLTDDVDVWHDQEVRSHVATLGQFGDSFVEPDADLIVTLHRTIDAQLAILRDASDAHPGDRERWLFTARQTAGEFWEQSKALAIALAEAILGGDK